METKTFYYCSNQFPQNKFCSELGSMITDYYGTHPPFCPITFVCIGTTKICGDSLGPCIGEELLRQGYPWVYGSFRHQIHACNLTHSLKKIEKEAPGLIIAIDASVGSPKHVGYITLSNQPLFPGKSLSKNLPPAGHVSITGIVSGEMEHPLESLNRTSKEQVLLLTKCIVTGILETLTPLLPGIPENQNQWIPQKNLL